MLNGNPLGAFLALTLLTATSARAEQGWQGASLSLYWENDAIAGKDRHYTQGAGILYLSPDNSLPRWLEKTSALLPSWDLDIAAQKFGVGLVQEIYTPEDLHSTALVEGDQPYAGWLYGRFTLQRRGIGLAGLDSKETLRLDLGVVGPQSLAEETQTTWHGNNPRGWKNQLDTELGFTFGYARHYLLPLTTDANTWGLNLIPLLELEAGTVSTLAKLGFTTRFGYRIPDDFKTTPPDPNSHYGFYFKAGLDGRYVARNIFLDGNTFESSHSVDKNAWVGSYHVGLTLVLKRVEISLLQTFRTREFKRQDTSDSVGRASITLKF